jgi:hypothetical protein
VHDASFTTRGGSYAILIQDNTSYLSNAKPTMALHPIHVLNEGTGNQLTVAGNHFRLGYRGYATGSRTNGLTNTNVVDNRMFGLSGAPLAAGGAGLIITGNYFNASGDFFAAGLSLSCDASCAGGTPITRGMPCQLDTDCTAGGNTCNASAFKCRPEPANGYIGSPTAVQGANHNTWIGNVLFNGITPLMQCTVAGNIGQRCDVASCAGGATCSGGPRATCQSGTDSGKFCCQTAAGATCAVREPLPLIRMVDYGVPVTHSLTNFTGNTAFTLDANSIWLDLSNTSSGANLTLTNFMVNGNNVYGAGPATGIGVKLPTVYASVTYFGMNGNNYGGLATDVANWNGTMGALSYVPMTMNLHADQTGNSTTFADVTDGTAPVQVALDGGRSYFFTCEPTFSSSVATTGIGYAMNYSGTYASFTYITRLPTMAVSTGAGTDNMFEQELIGSDPAGAQTSIGVGTAGTKYMANVRGNIVTTSAGILTLRYKAENANNITNYAGTNCIAFQVP